MKDAIRITGARQNNLKNISVDIPLNRISVITGVSGSGKSSLAFDTVFAEGQRRYIESFSAYARQFMDRMDKPDVDHIEGILPAIAINQSNPVKSSRSTLGTLTEITDYVKLLFPRLATLFCEQCGSPVEKDSPAAMVRKILTGFGGSRCVVAFPFAVSADERVTPEEIEQGLRRQGFFRICESGAVSGISTALIAAKKGGVLYIVADRLVVSESAKKRLLDSLETAVAFGRGRVTLFFPEQDLRPATFSTGFHCARCDIRYRSPVPGMFSFNSPLGACEHCNGFGKTIEVDIGAVIPDTSLSLQEDAIKPWSTPAYRDAYHELIDYCKAQKIPVDIPFSDLSGPQKEMVIEGDDHFYGVRGFFRWLETKTYKMHIRVLLSKYRAYEPCRACGGTRFKRPTLQYRIGGCTIADIYAKSISELLRFFESFRTQTLGDKTVRVLLNEIVSRLSYLDTVGLGYLTLDRQSRTLSGGEVQRASLTTALGSSLVNTLYVLDEPSIGLHPRDTHLLMDILKGLRDTGNTIVLVEHEPDIIRNCDYVIDLGPGSGRDGGSVAFRGSPQKLLSGSSLTGRYLSGALQIPLPKERKKTAGKAFIQLSGAAVHNLKNLHAAIPLSGLVCITGVSGSGKSTLLENVLHSGLGKAGHKEQWCRFTGKELPRQVILMDQSPIGKTPRSNPLTYMHIFEPVRSLFSQTECAKQRGYSPSTFSFNTSGGRCEQCRGEGFEKIEMQFLADIYVTCPYCSGTRFFPEILEVTYRGKNINQVLEMTVAEARSFFADTPKVEYPLRLLDMIGLGYLRLGQSANTLSGGESQRLKLASFILKGSGKRTLFLFDEPTTGLHPADITKLLDAFDFLIANGHSVIVVEHNLDIIKCADYIVDLGPEGGEEGGFIVAQGPPADIVAEPASHTGRFLKKYLTESSDGAGAEELPCIAEKARGPEQTAIHINGAREHNLQNITVDIPRQKVVVITGLSGSGKSTLAFDILFAEGQRRFLETLSPYARQYITQLQRPEVDTVKGVPPTVAIEQLLSRGGKKSTVATVTEIYHYLRLLFAKAGRRHCPECGAVLSSRNPTSIARAVARAFKKDIAIILAPQVKGRKGFHKNIIEKAKRDGFEKIRIDGRIVKLNNIFAIKRYHEHQLELVTAEVYPAGLSTEQLQEEVNRALALGRGEIMVSDGKQKEAFYSTQSFCSRCKISVEAPDPRLFSFNSEHGACSFCAGVGTCEEPSPELLMSRPEKSLLQGGVEALDSALLSPKERKKIRERIKTEAKIPLNVPVGEFTPAQVKTLFYGNKCFPGLVALLQSPEKAEDERRHEYLRRFCDEVSCPACKGARLKPEALSVLIGNKSIAELVALTPDRLHRFLSKTPFTKKEQQITGPILQELLPKLDLLNKAGLSYLSLDRRADTLSGGEAQRMRLAAQVASNLKGVAYVLDEPTIGLHPHDNRQLQAIIRDLHQKGNSIIIVEHDEETIRQADYVIDLGPGGGTGGGKIVAAGSPRSLMEHPESVTGACLVRKSRGTIPFKRRSVDSCPFILVSGAGEHNLRNIAAGFPVGRLCVVTGVSGSGKTTLVRTTLYKVLKRELGDYHGRVGAFRSIQGAEHVRRAVEIDQSPIGKTPRSVPATYVGFYDEIRRVFSQVPESRMRGYSARRFSFNLRGGRCEKCSGQGKIKVSMNFLPDMYVDCDLCRGARFNEETRQILFKGKSIDQVLAMTVQESLAFFADIPGIRRPLSVLDKMGLGYLTLGQPSPTLSGGEAQRIKIATELCTVRHGQTLYVLDEPTTGLHAADIEKLMSVLQELVDSGNTMVIIEHNLDVISQADYIIDLGPGGGNAGGRIVAEGRPEEIIEQPADASCTAAHLKEHLGVAESTARCSP